MTDQAVEEIEPAAPAAPEPVSRWRALVAWFADVLWHSPVSLGLLAALWVIGAVTGSLRGPDEALLARYGAGVIPLELGRWWTPITSGLWCASLAAYIATTLILVLVCAPAERRIGSLRTLGVLLACQIAGVLLAVGLAKVGSFGDWWLTSIAATLAVGGSTGPIGAALAASALYPTLWRRRLRLFMILTLAILALYIGELQDLIRLLGGLVGLGLGALLFRRVRDRSVPHRSSHTEVRVLVALVVAAAGIGALAATFVPFPVGPLSAYSDFFAARPESVQHVNEVCADPSLAGYCRSLRTERLFAAYPPRLMAVMPALFLLVAAEGLRRGKRLAWWVAAALNAAVLVLVVGGIFVTPPDEQDSGFLWNNLEPLLLPVGTIVVLLLTRRHFDRPVPRSSGRRIALVSGVVLAALIVLHLVAGWFLRHQFDPVATLSKLVRGLPARLLPPFYSDLVRVPVVPTGGLPKAIYMYGGLIFWLTVLLGLLWAFTRAGTAQDSAAQTKARALLASGGGSTLSYMTTWPGNTYWFAADGRAAVAYRVVGGVAVTTGDPFGEPDARAAAVGRFAAFCGDNGWTPCFYSVTQPIRAAAEALGWKSVQVAEDTVIPLGDLAFTGKKWQDVRTALNKAKKEGITAEWWTYPKAPLAITDQVRAISEEWVADKGMPEMGFTLGGLDELNDPDVRCLIALDEQRTVHGVTSWLPVYADGMVTGWTLDFMRRRANGFRGVVEFLIASAGLGAQEEGAKFLSLSGAPLARLDRGEDFGPLQKLLDGAGKALEPVYGFRSLFAFKAKFQPAYEPLYMAYPDPAALPAIGNAIGRAYLPHMTAGQGLRLVRRLVG